jgi:hypothetical protein
MTEVFKDEINEKELLRHLKKSVATLEGNVRVLEIAVHRIEKKLDSVKKKPVKKTKLYKK